MSKFSNNKIKGFYDNEGANTSQTGVVSARELYSKRVQNVWTEKADIVTFASGTTPFIYNYKKNPVTNIYEAMPAPDVAPNSGGQHVAWSPDGNYLAYVGTSSAYLSIYKRNGINLTKLTVATAPGGGSNCVAWSPDGTHLAVAHSISPYVTIYSRSGDTFTKLANPASLPASTGNGCHYSPDGLYLAIAHSTSPFVAIYSRSGDTYTKLTNPAGLPTGTGYSVAFNRTSSVLAVAHNTTPFITLYDVQPTQFVKLPTTFQGGMFQPSALVGTGFFVTWGRLTGYDVLAVAHSASPYYTLLSWQGSGWGDYFSLSPPTGATTSVAYPSLGVNGNKFVFASSVSPYYWAYGDDTNNGTVLSTNPPAATYGVFWFPGDKYL